MNEPTATPEGKVTLRTTLGNVIEVDGLDERDVRDLAQFIARIVERDGREHAPSSEGGTG